MTCMGGLKALSLLPSKVHLHTPDIETLTMCVCAVIYTAVLFSQRMKRGNNVMLWWMLFQYCIGLVCLITAL